MAINIEPRTDEQITALRKQSITYTDIEKFTCDDCEFKRTCEFVFDWYNTDGDCLAEKWYGARGV